jgi:hypothetical protein
MKLKAITFIPAGTQPAHPDNVTTKSFHAKEADLSELAKGLECGMRM